METSINNDNKIIENNIFGIKFVLEFLGVYESKIITIKQILAFISFGYMIINCILSAKNNWDNINYRYTAIRNLNVLMTLVIIYIDYTVRNGTIKELRKLVESGLFKYVDWITSVKSKEILNRYNKNILNFNKIIFYFSLAVAMSMIIVPMFLALFILFFNNYNSDDYNNKNDNNDLKFEDLPIPFKTLYFPTGYNVMKTYIMNYIFQSFVTMTILLNVGYCAFIIAFDTTNLVANEIELLCSCLDEMDNTIFCGNNKNYANKIGDYDCHNDLSEIEKKMKIYMKNLVDHHSTIMRKIRIIENGLQVNTSAFSHALIMQTCMSIYIIVQVDIFSLKLENFVTAVSVLLNMYLSYNQAQTIYDKGEELRQKIFHCGWIDKPLWFRKSIFIMATSSNKELRIKPLGIYVMNRHTFLKIINTSYSYFNVINSVKNA